MDRKRICWDQRRARKTNLTEIENWDASILPFILWICFENQSLNMVNLKPQRKALSWRSQRRRKPKEKRDRIHGYQSRMQVGKGSDKKADSSIWAGAVTQKPPIVPKKLTRTDQWTYQLTDIAGYRVAWTRLKKGKKERKKKKRGKKERKNKQTNRQTN